VNRSRIKHNCEGSQSFVPNLNATAQDTGGFLFGRNTTADVVSTVHFLKLSEGVVRSEGFTEGKGFNLAKGVTCERKRYSQVV